MATILDSIGLKFGCLVNVIKPFVKCEGSYNEKDSKNIKFKNLPFDKCDQK